MKYLGKQGDRGTTDTGNPCTCQSVSCDFSCTSAEWRWWTGTTSRNIVCFFVIKLRSRILFVGIWLTKQIFERLWLAHWVKMCALFVSRFLSCPWFVTSCLKLWQFFLNRLSRITTFFRYYSPHAPWLLGLYSIAHWMKSVPSRLRRDHWSQCVVLLSTSSQEMRIPCEYNCFVVFCADGVADIPWITCGRITDNNKSSNVVAYCLA